MSERELAQKVYAQQQKSKNPSAFDTIGAFNKYYNADKKPGSLALPLDMGKSIPPRTREEAIASYNSKIAATPARPGEPGFWGKAFTKMEQGYNFATQALSFGLTLTEKGNPLWNGNLDFNRVKESWNASHDISAGRAIVRQLGKPVDAFENAFSGIVKTVSGGKLSGADKFMQDHILFAANNFDIFNKQQSEKAFREQVVGRVGSFATDVVARFVIDPTIVGGKAIKAYKGIGYTVKAAGDLQKALSGAETGFKARKVKATFNSFLENTDGMVESDLFRVKAIRESSNPATFSSLIAEANKIESKALRHQAKADIIFMAQGDAAAATRLMESSRLIAAKVASLNDEVASARHMGAGIDKATGQLTFDLVNSGTDLEKATELIVEHEDELARLHKQLSAEAILDPNIVPRVDVGSGLRQVFSRSQSLIDVRTPAGITAGGVRVMTGFFYKRPKGWIDFNDNQSVQTIDNMLSRVRGKSEKQSAVYQSKIDNLTSQLKDKSLTPGDKKEIVKGIKLNKESLEKSRFTVERRDALFVKYTNALDAGGRANAYQEIEKEIFSTIARQYGFSDDAVKKAWATFHTGRAKTQNLIRERAYTGSKEAAEAARAKPIVGAEDASYVIPLPLNETQLVHQLPTLHIDQMYASLNKYTRGARFDKNGKVYKTVRHGQEVGNELIGALDSVIKFEVLARIGYPIRNVTEGMMRIMSVTGPMAIMKGASVASKNLISNRFVGSTFQDVFKWSNTVKLQTKRAELVAASTTAKSTKLIDNQIKEIDAMLAGGPIKDKYGMGLNQVDGISYTDALGATPEQARAISDRFIRNAATIMDDTFIESRKILTRAYETNGDFVIISGSDPGWVDGFIRVVNRQVRGSKITTKLLAGESIDDVTTWLETNPEGRAIMRNLALGRDTRSIVEANNFNLDSLFPKEISPELRAIAAKRHVTADDVEKYYGTTTELRPNINAAQVGTANGTSAVSKAFTSFLSGFYNIMGEIPEANLVRHPLFVDLYRQRVEASIRHAIETVPGKTIAPEYLRKVENSARQWARAEMRRTLYDTSERVDSAHTLKYIFPFFGAFADVVQKWGRILVDDPTVIRKLETVYDSPDRMGLVEERDGIRYINIPGEWAKRMHLGDRPLAIPKPSLNLIFQGGAWWNPGAGWFVQYAASALLKKVPDLEQNALIKEILPYGPDGTGWKDLAIQSAGLRKVLAYFDEKDPMRANLTVTIAMEENHKFDSGLRTTAPTTKEINDKALKILALEAASRFILPFASNTRSPYQFYIDEYQKMRQDDALNAAENFWNKYGDDYYIFTTSRSKNNTGVQATIEADRTAKELSDLIAKNPEYGWFVVGDANNGEFSPTVYKKQREQAVAPGSTKKFRESQDPYDAVRDTQAQKGWISYNKGIDYLESQRIARGLKSLNSKGAEDLLAAKQKFVEELSLENPAWAEVRGKIDTNKVNNFLKFAKELTLDKRIANRSDIKAVADYFTGRDYIRGLLAQRTSQSLDNTENIDLKEMWDMFIGEMIDENLTFSRVYTRILENDDLRKGF